MSHEDFDLAKGLTVFLRNRIREGVDPQSWLSIQYILNWPEFWDYSYGHVARILYEQNWHARRRQPRFDVWWTEDVQKPDGYDYHIRLAPGQEVNREEARSHRGHRSRRERSRVGSFWILTDC